MAKWDEVFLKDAHRRLKSQMDGYELGIRDVKDFVSFTHDSFLSGC